MTEIEKMFENAGIKKEKKKMLDIETDKICLTLDKLYPPFTAEKQIEIVCFLINRGIELSFKCEQGKINTQVIQRSLVGLINNLWQDLTDQEKEEIRRILNE